MLLRHDGVFVQHFSSICAATLRAQSSHSVSTAKSANLSNGAPDWRAPKNSPGPRISRSRRAISNPSLVSTIALRRALAVSPSRAASPVDYSSTQADAAAPRPTTDTDSAYTWWSNRGQAYAKNVGWRLDYHLATPAIAARAHTEHIYKDQRFSDHAPITVDYALSL